MELSIQSSSLPSDAHVFSLQMREELASIYTIDAHFHTFDAAFDPDSALLQGVVLKLLRGAEPSFYAGEIHRIELVQQVESSQVYHIVVHPKLQRLKYLQRSRVYTNKAIDKVLEEALQAGGLEGGDYRFELSGKYQVEEHICQYDESEFDFFQRWIEREGMYYFFEHSEEGVELVITDSKTTHQALSNDPIHYYPQQLGDFTTEDVVTRFRPQLRSSPKSIKLRDYDYEKPSLSVAGESDVTEGAFGEEKRYEERFFTPAEGKRLAKLRAETIIAQRARCPGAATSEAIRAGFLFTLEGYPDESVNKAYLVTSVNLRALDYSLSEGVGEQDAVFELELEAIDAAVQFRPAPTVEWPRVRGVQRATVDGAADSPYAQLDSDGRYNLKMAFDESDLNQGNASTRCRTMQPHGGSNEGYHMPLRKGVEVLVSFLGGDPDRPLVAGSVPNALYPSPVTSSNHTKNIFRSGNEGHIEIEDLESNEYVNVWQPIAETQLHLGCPAVWAELGVSDSSVSASLGMSGVGEFKFTYGGDSYTDVCGIKDDEVTDSVTQLYGSTQKTTVDLNVKEDYGSYIHLVSGEHKRTHEADQDTTVDGATIELYGVQETNAKTSHTQEVTGMQTHLVGFWEQSYGPYEMNWGPTVSLVGVHSWSVTGDSKVDAPLYLVLAGMATRVMGSQDIKGGAHIGLYGTKAAVVATYAKATVHGLKVDIGGVQVGAAGLKDDGNGLNIAIAASDDSNAGAEMKVHALNLVVYANDQQA